MSNNIVEGMTYEVDYPFVRTSYIDFEGGEVPSWRPGHECRFVYPDDSEFVYDEIGKQLLTVVSIHKPSPYPARVFYTVQWVDPDGKKFGKNALKICVKSRFVRLISGYMSQDSYFRMHQRKPKE